MANIRVGDLAKELNISNKEVLEALKKRNVELKSHLSAVQSEDADALRQLFSQHDNNTDSVKKRRPRPEGAEGERPRRPRPEGAEGERPRRPRSEGAEGERPRRPRPEGAEGERPRRPRPEGAEGERPRRPRPEGAEGERPRRPRPEGAEGERPRRLRPESVEGERRRRPRPEGAEGERPRRPRPESAEGERRRRPRPEGVEGERPRRPRPEGAEGERPRRPRPEGVEGERLRRPRPQDIDGEKTRNSRTDNQERREDRRHNDTISAVEVMKPDSKENRRNAEKKREDKKREERQREDKKNSKNKNKGKVENKEALQKPVKQKPVEPEIKTITIPETLTIRDLADAMKMQPSVIIKQLFMAGVIATPNTEIDYEKAEEIALEYEILVEKEVVVDPLEEIMNDPEDPDDTMQERPPVVCVMGHVDHGKTSLLDAIRASNVTSGEAGGITQHIGASVVKSNGKTITFLDTPGHEAFTSMRMRGAQSTDIAILVVAADDGVMPQTVEAINHAKAAGTEIIVAINKIDKESANIERVKQELMEHELIAEDWGGSTVFCPVSAHTKQGIDELLDMILLTAEVMELRANPNRKARGVVIEAELDKGKGATATILVQKGTLHVGDSIAVGNACGKIRAMVDDKGRRIKEAGPSTPVEILGLNDVPAAGEIFIQTENEKEARSISDIFIAQSRERLLADTKTRLSLDDLFDQIQAGNVKELNLVIKADVQGSVEAVKQSLLKLSNDEVVVKVVHGGVGAINESDVSLAMASNAIIIGFNVRPDVMAKQVAEREKVDLRLYKVIYNAIEDIERAMKGMLDPIYEEKVIGHAEVRQTYKASGVGTIAGSYVLDGTIQRNCKVRITREGEQIFEGSLASLKRFKDDVKEVKTGYECGLVFDNFNDIKEEDQIEAYIMVEVPR